MQWNPKHRDHFSRSKKIDAWDAITGNLNISVGEVKQKMNSLLGSLRREKAKRKKTVGTRKGNNKLLFQIFYQYLYLFF